jgi:hypothetical protein
LHVRELDRALAALREHRANGIIKYSATAPEPRAPRFLMRTSR